jgi:hypothetical protein
MPALPHPLLPGRHRIAVLQERQEGSGAPVNMRTWSGEIAPLELGLGKVQPLDLVILLGREHRFGGNADPEYTVHHHAMLCAMLWLIAGYPVEEVVHVLVHDHHEAYTGDLTAPVKAAIRRRAKAAGASDDPVAMLERDIDARIRERLNLCAAGPGCLARIKVIDQTALVIESMVFGPPGCGEDVTERLDVNISVEVWRIVSASGALEAAAARGRRA